MSEPKKYSWMVEPKAPRASKKKSANGAGPSSAALEPVEEEPVEQEYPDPENYPGLRIPLFPHQKKSVEDMERMERTQEVVYEFGHGIEHYTFPSGYALMYEVGETGSVQSRRAYYMQVKAHTQYAYLGDIPGYGKSYSILALILRNKMEWPLHETWDVPVNLLRGGNMGTTREYLHQFPWFQPRLVVPYKRIRATLILCPMAVIFQWVEYLENTFLDWKLVHTTKLAEETNPKDYDVILVTPTFFNSLVRRFPGHAWKRFVYDDPTNCHVVSMEPIIAGFTWMMMADYNRFINGKTWVADMHEAFRQWGSRNLVIRNPDEVVKQSFQMPPVHITTHKCFNPLAEVASRFGDAHVSQLIGAGNIAAAIQHLGGDHTSTADIFSLINKRNKEFVVRAECRVADLECQMNDSVITNSRRAYLQQQLDTARKEVATLNQTIQNMRERVSYALSQPCGICSDDITQAVMTPCCMHVFCGACLFDWFKTKNRASCPMCRADVAINMLVHISDTAVAAPGPSQRDKQQSKPMTAVRLIKEALAKPNGSVLLFSSENYTFGIIRGFLDEERIPYAEVKGGYTVCKKLVAKYRAGKIKVLFLNTNFSGAGLNLENTTDMVIYHPLDSQQQLMQITGRALRVGRSKELFVHILE